MNNPKLNNQEAGDPTLRPTGPIYALLQHDFPYQENVDSGHPLNLDYFIPINCQRVITARLSFRLRLYRTYSNFSVTGTSTDATNTTPAADATGESGHSHSHAHTITFGAAGVAISIGTDAPGTGWQSNATGAFTGPPTNGNAVGSSGHSHSHTHGAHNHSHSHTVSGSSFLGVSEDVNNAPTIAVQFDGIDHTADMLPAGPYTSDQVEIDVTKFVSTFVDRAWHTISLLVQAGAPNPRGRIQAVLRVLYSSNQV